MDQILLKDIPKEKDYPIAHLLRVSDMQLREGKRGPFLQFSVGDRTADFRWCKKWDSSENEYNRLKKESILFLTGKTDVYNDNLQVVADSIAVPEDMPSDALAKLIPCSKYELKDLKKTLYDYLGSINNEFIKQLCRDFLKDPLVKEKLDVAWAAIGYHHPYRSGLLTHIVRLMHLVDSVTSAFNDNMYPGGKYRVNRDMLILGAFLHDLFKISEYSSMGDYENYGNLVPHLPKGAIEANRKMDKIENFPEDLRDQITHLILSHHGEIAYGSPVTPCTVEAVILHYCDNLAAKADPMLEALDDLPDSENWTDRLKGIGKKAYRGGMLL